MEASRRIYVRKTKLGRQRYVVCHFERESRWRWSAAPMFVACGGGNADDAGVRSTSPQCSGASCGTQGAPAVGAGAAPLCPATADIVASTYLGGAGGGEIVSLNIDAVKMTYTLKWLESPIPLVTGTVNPTRKGTTIAGRRDPPTSRHAADSRTDALRIRPDARWRQGVGRLDVHDRSRPSTRPIRRRSSLARAWRAAAFRARRCSTTARALTAVGVHADPRLPAIVPRAEPPFRLLSVYRLLRRSARTIADLKGTYNALLYHTVPSNNYATTTTQAQESFDTAGNCTVPVHRPRTRVLPDDRRRVDRERDRRFVLHERTSRRRSRASARRPCCRSSARITYPGGREREHGDRQDQRRNRADRRAHRSGLRALAAHAAEHRTPRKSTTNPASPCWPRTRR